jgi:hypothetical protein
MSHNSCRFLIRVIILKATSLSVWEAVSTMNNSFNGSVEGARAISAYPTEVLQHASQEVCNLFMTESVMHTH